MNNAVIIIEKVWIEGILVDANKLNVGKKITVHPISIREIPEFEEVT